RPCHQLMTRQRRLRLRRPLQQPQRQHRPPRRQLCRRLNLFALRALTVIAAARRLMAPRLAMAMAWLTAHVSLVIANLVTIKMVATLASPMLAILRPSRLARSALVTVTRHVTAREAAGALAKSMAVSKATP